MTKVEIVLYDADEMYGFAQFHAAVLARRAKLAATLTQTPVPQQTSVPNEAVVEAMYESREVQPGESVTPFGAPQPEKMDRPTARTLFEEYLGDAEKGGLLKAKAKLEAFGAKQFKDIPDEKLGEFVASLR